MQNQNIIDRLRITFKDEVQTRETIMKKKR